MKRRIEVFDPAMCCSTGVCGPQVDAALVRFAADLRWLATQDVEVERFNLAQQPQAFAASDLVKSELAVNGNECLPLILVDGAVVSRGRYPAKEELAKWVGAEVHAAAPASLPVIQTPCC
jgi:hypothetical protein